MEGRMCVQDCEFCSATVKADTVSEVKERGKAHLESDHYEEFANRFAETYAGKQCQDGCGYTYPTNVEAVAGFDCPDCGHDHFDSFAGQYLYWQIEIG